jgi:hypothetical protein
MNFKNYPLGEVFWIFWIFQFSTGLDWQKNSKTKVERRFFYFHVFPAGNGVFGPKK